MSKVIAVMIVAMVFAISASAASNITASTARADGHDYSGDVCNSTGLICDSVGSTAAYDTNPNATAGHTQWTTYTRICYSAINGGLVYHSEEQQGWGPFSTNVESTPIFHKDYNTGLGC